MAMIKGLPATEPSNDGIQAALGLSGYIDYAVLMRPDLYGPKQDIIKFWAKYQPMHANVIGKLTEDYRRENGFGIVDNYNYVYTNSTHLNDAWNKLQSNIYSLFRAKPTGDINISPFRPWDFYSEDGTLAYNNEAVCPLSFAVEEVKDRGFMQITAHAIKDDELPDANITVSDLQTVGGKNNIIAINSSTCFGLLYRKDGGSVQVLGANGQYPVYMDNEDIRVSNLQFVGDGTYQFAYIILNTVTKRFITLPFPIQTATVTSTGLVKGYVEVFGMYETNTTGTQITISKLTIIPRGANAVAGTVGIYVCNSNVPSNQVESSAIKSYTYDYPATAKDTPYVFSNKMISVSGYNVNEVVLWAVTTTASGEKYRTPLDMIDNSEDIS